MKTILLIVAGLCLASGICFRLAGRHSQSTASNESSAAAQSVPAQPPTEQSAPAPAVMEPSKPVAVASKPAQTSKVKTAESPLDGVNLADPEVFKQVLDALTSPKTSFAEKQAIWKQLKDSGKLNEVISSLEQRITASPDSADAAAALGQAYLKKCGTIDDVRQKGIFAMRADEVFDQALATDPSNWDARFYKAVGMSFWPEQLNKGQEVINNFQTLIQQQESGSPQPQFAQVYMWLGDQYQKSGASESAAEVWQRGAALFPDNSDLKSRLAGRH